MAPTDNRLNKFLLSCLILILSLRLSSGFHLNSKYGGFLHYIMLFVPNESLVSKARPLTLSLSLLVVKTTVWLTDGGALDTHPGPKR